MNEVVMNVHHAKGTRKKQYHVAELVRVIHKLSGTAEPNSKSVAGLRNTPSQAGVGLRSRQPDHDQLSGRDPYTQTRKKR
jgi:hypothetical protein